MSAHRVPGVPAVIQFTASHPENVTSQDAHGGTPSATVWSFDYAGAHPVPKTPDRMEDAGMYYGPAGELP
jgi:hypothetical protein